MPIQKLIKNYIKTAKTCIAEAYTYKDKLVLIQYYLKTPIFLFRYLQGSSKKRKLSSPIRIKNKYGIFFTGDRVHTAFGFSSKSESEVRKQLQLKEGVFVDIGANGGMYTVPIAKRIGRRGKVIAIEPEPNNLNILKKNIQLNKLKNVICINAACYESEGILKLFLDKEGQGGHSLIENTPVKKKGYIQVKTKKLDNIIKEHKIKKVDLIKIDVEGAEASVLKGSKKVLRRDHPRIIFEAWDNNYLKKIEEILKEFNYSIKRIDSNNYLAEQKRIGKAYKV